MRLTLFIFIVCSSCLCFGQDSLKVDTTLKSEPVVSQKEDTKPVKDNDDGNMIIIIGIFIIAIIAIFKYARLFFNSKEIYSSVGSQSDDEMPDYVSRQLLPRREYYRNVYLKSEAWKRKRYVVLKRDN